MREKVCYERNMGIKMQTQQNVKLEITVQEICYYLFFSLLFFAKGIGLYDGQNLFKVFLILSMLFLGIKLMVTEYTVKEVAVMALITTAAVLSYLNTREKGILFTLMIVIGLKNIPLKRLFGVALGVWSISFLPIAALTTLGWIDSPFRVHVRPLVGFVIRWGLGSAHPNVGHIAYLIFTILSVYALGKKLAWKWCGLLFGGNCFVFLYTMSQTGLLMTTFYLVAVIYVKYRKYPSKLEYAMVNCIVPGCLLFSLILPLVLKGRAFDILNKLMNTRTMQSRRYLTEERITLFGTGLQLNNAINTMDNSFLFAFMTYGVITFIILMTAYVILIGKFTKEKKNSELAIIVTLLIAGLSEPFLFNTSFKNISLLFMGGLLFSETEVQKGFWAGKICLFEEKNRKMEISIKGLSEFLGRMKKCIALNKRKIAMGAAAAGVLWALVYVCMVKAPQQIVVPRSLCDSVEQESIFIGEDVIMEDSAILGYVNEDEPMVAFTGTLVEIEYIRGILCRLIYGSLIGFVVVSCGYYMIKYNNSGK